MGLNPEGPAPASGSHGPIVSNRVTRGSGFVLDKESEPDDALGPVLIVSAFVSALASFATGGVAIVRRDRSATVIAVTVVGFVIVTLVLGATLFGG